MSDPTLHPCPFCGSDDVGICHVVDQPSRVECWKCHAEGPPADSSKDPGDLAVERWNARRGRNVLTSTIKLSDESLTAIGALIETLYRNTRAREATAQQEPLDPPQSRTYFPSHTSFD